MRHDGSLTAASSRVGACISKYRASVSAEVKVREGDELRHHARVPVVKVVTEAGARTMNQVLWPADHTAKLSLVNDVEGALRWRCCAALRTLASGSRNAPHTGIPYDH